MSANISFIISSCLDRSTDVKKSKDKKEAMDLWGVEEQLCVLLINVEYSTVLWQPRKANVNCRSYLFLVYLRTLFQIDYYALSHSRDLPVFLSILICLYHYFFLSHIDWTKVSSEHSMDSLNLHSRSAALNCTIRTFPCKFNSLLSAECSKY